MPRKSWPGVAGNSSIGGPQL